LYGWARRFYQRAECVPVRDEQGRYGQIGKNHFGDLNKYLPTVHGSDEFFGNLYHLNAEEEPEQEDYPHKDQFVNSTTLRARRRHSRTRT